MTCRTTAQYLSRYAESETQLLVDFPPRRYGHCIVIPCFRETPDFALRLMNGPLCDKNLLAIVVINQCSSPAEPLNQALLSFFSTFITAWENAHLRLCRKEGAALDWLVVNRTASSLLLPPKQGVGLARKIGCDIAVQLAQVGIINAPWLHSTDADAHLPDDYLELPPAPSYSAAVYEFTHIRAAADIREWEATQLYEQALRYYVAGLRWAGSPYARQPIGSVLAFTIKAYCEVRGFPKRSAGEDFYLLNKLTKVGNVYDAKTTVALDARISDRVPFGTGPKVKAILDLNDPTREFSYYAPMVFVQLKTWLETIPTVWQALQASQGPLTQLSAPAQEALIAAGIDKLWPHLLAQASSARACERAIHTWFDAFQTLKFIRRLQTEIYPPLPLQQCLRDAPFSCSM